MKKRILTAVVITVAALLAASCEGGKSSVKTGGTQVSGEQAPYKVMAEKLQAPWVIAFDGNVIYISERDGNVVRVAEGKSTRMPVQFNKNVHAQGEGGFLGFVLAPDFRTSKEAFAYHTYEENGQILNRVIVLKLEENSWVESKALLEGIPGSFNHDGGRMAIGPDGLLYVTTGDAGREELAQDKNSLAGKILRMKLDGTIPPGNPFPDSYVYSYGHRNPQGLAWSSSGMLFVAEHGPSGNPGGHDEINSIVPGGNYGWPVVIGGQHREGMIDPIYHTGEDTIAPSGIAMEAGNNLLVATLRGEKLLRYNTLTKKMSTVLENEGRLRDVRVHNGDIYVITNNTDGRGTPSDKDDRLLLLAK
ncbi:glucose/arabinose dehydrogenase [Paenibacillus sp. BK033]|uniref:PQQ-dependent sugar dehydrogenase n=1 Tax=Paenibacillus sp. BK033 TaxID=2512133 RepID=UPI00104E1830|nr:PQQ-dependent sugar dehydrogenase [Paenibacillus sp. BK033]TCM93319.1 glucose/arabinose dehydrogenase [Paenibacillus sp. BK033]